MSSGPEAQAIDAKAKPAQRRGRSPLLLILLTVFVDLIGFGVIVPLLPFYNRTFGGGPAVLGLLIASFFLMQFLFAPLLGRLSDRFGRRPILLGTLAVATTGHLVLASASSLVFLFLARMLAGFAAGNLSVARAYIADRTRPEERARGMGLVGAAFGVGFAVGPVIGGIFAPLGLSAPALAAATLAGTNLILAAAFLPESLPRELRTARGAPKTAGLGEAVRRPSIRPLVLTFLVVSFAFATVPVAFPSLGIDYFHLGEQQLAAIFVLIGAVQIVVGASVGRLAKRFEEVPLVAVGTLAMAGAMAATPFLRDLTGYVLLVGLFAMGVALSMPLLLSLVSKRTPAHEQGSILGAVQAIGSLGVVPGPLVAGLLYERVTPAAPFLVSAVLMGGAFLMTLLVYRDSRRVPAAVPLASVPRR